MTARFPSRSALIALALSALAVSLGGCGRKGPLDLPPTAQTSKADTATEESRDLGPAAIFDPSAREPEPEEPRGKKKKFILDPLLGDK